MRPRALLAAVALLASIVLPATAARAATWPVATRLKVLAPTHAGLGQTLTLRAQLTAPKGLPVQGATVSFVSPASWGDLKGDMAIGSALTDGQGVATLTVPMRRSGDVQITAVFAGDVRHLPSRSSTSIAVAPGAQLVKPTAGIRIPGLGIWVLAMVLMLIWGLYLVAGGRAIRISRSAAAIPATQAIETNAALAALATSQPAVPQGIGRRQFFGRAFPVGVEAGLAALGGGLLTILARSPKTHANLADSVPVGYDRTPVAYVGKNTPAAPLPPVLDREVSFANDVLPILTSRAGPHVMFPNDSPPPGGMRLDTYKHMNMMTEVIVPGKPESSLLVQVLLDPGKRMPPVGNPLPQDEIQIVASWIAQGAKDN